VCLKVWVLGPVMDNPSHGFKAASCQGVSDSKWWLTTREGKNLSYAVASLSIIWKTAVEPFTGLGVGDGCQLHKIPSRR
jgi:hypothetical protein